MKKTIFYLIFVSFVFLFPLKTNAQFNNDTQAAFYDIGFGAVIGGIGAIINKKPTEKTGNVFIKGFWQGALGGYFVFESKRLIRATVKQDSYRYFWPSKIVNSFGNSILENAAANRDFWEQYHFNIGFNRLEFDLKNKGKFTYKIMPFALYATVNGFINGNLDVNKSLCVGTFIFKSNKEIQGGNFFNAGSAEAYSLTNQILYDENFFSISTLGHEIIHTYQYEQAVNFNSFFIKPKNYFSGKHTFLKAYNKLFYTDFNVAIFYTVYRLNNNYNTNIFEREARFYSE
ncbi:hypothetical protein [Polaribacter sp.]|uniref:hypothetical protein n=1 Tax=Polaribacter sp. TaxID=1920175 RepID=UPI004048B9E7